MDRLELQEMLEPATGQTDARLPETFAAQVLRKGKRMRGIVRRHWRWLRWATLISILIAGTLGVVLPKFSAFDSPPPLPLFHGGGDRLPIPPK